LKTLPQFLATEQQQQLNSLIPATLSDVTMINEKIITFIVITLSFSSSSGGMTKLCDIVDELIGSSNCIQETPSGENLVKIVCTIMFVTLMKQSITYHYLHMSYLY